MNKRHNRLAWLLLFLCMTSATLRAQDNASPYDGHTPEGLERGGAGSDFASVNLATGSLNFSLPLLTIGGRGKAGYTMRYAFDKRWAFERIPCNPSSFCPDHGYKLRAKDSEWNLIEPGLGPGVMVARRAGKDTRGCATTPKNWDIMLTRLTFIGPDGSETSFVDAASNGEPKEVACVNGVMGQPYSRGTVWYSTDGSAATFISTAAITDGHTPGHQFYPSGTLKWKDGATYIIAEGKVTRIADTDGNYVDLIYVNHKVTQITDSLKRTVTIAYNTASPASTTISYKGYAGAERTITIAYNTAPSTWLRPDFTGTQTVTQAFPEINASFLETPNIPINGIGATQITMPDGRGYRLFYNNYAELARIDLPTGGKTEYDYGAGYDVAPSGANQMIGVELIYRRVKERRVFKHFADAVPVGVTRYRRDSRESPTVVDMLAPGSSQLLERANHYHRGDPKSAMSPWVDPIRYPAHDANKEFKTEFLSSDGTTVLRTIEYDYQPRVIYPWAGYDCQLRSVTTTLNDILPNLVSKGEHDYDNYNNITQEREYDFGAGAPGPLIRRAQTSYLTTNGNQGNVNYATELNIHIRNLPVQRIIYDASGNIRSQTDFIYDNYGPHPLVDRSGIVQHDVGFDAGYGTRGHLTRAIDRNPGGSPPEIQLNYQYDIAGNMVKSVDGRGFPTNVDFSDRFGSQDDDARSNAGAPELAGGFTYAFPTAATNALGHTSYIQYDYYLGKPVNTEDANGVVSSVAYDDALDRPTRRILARYIVGVGAPATRRQTTINYDDANRVVTTTGDLAAFNDNLLTGKSYYDGLGRTWRSASDEGATWAITDTQFDALGRVSQVSNPYREADPNSASPPSGLWTKNVYDSLSRVVDFETPDGAHVITQYSGNKVTVIDQAGKRRRSETDGLARLIRVTEDPGGSNYSTSYSYDVHGNLLQVTQGSQTRNFVYNSWSQLISATNPENGTTTYAYDANGNLIEKTDARGVRTTITYDALNRSRSKVYAGATPEGTAAANATPTVSYFYDDYSALPSGAPTWPGTPSKGRMIGVTYGGGSDGTYFKYNAAGRIATNHQRMGTANYATTYTFNLIGAVTREDRGNPVRRRNVMTYDEAGRLSVMQTGAFSGAGIVLSDLVRDISYTPFGALQSEKYGNGLIHSMGYNNRQQPTEIRLGRLDNLESVLRIGYIYGTTPNVNVQDPEITLAHNNGNVARIKYFISGTLQYSQTFLYDGINRLSYAVEHNNGAYNDASRAWYQTFVYGPPGNRGIDVDNTSDNMDAANNALKLADFSAANNRITRAGYAYDSNGNLIAEPNKTYTYNADNKLVTATVAGVGTIQNFYDGSGRLVRKVAVGVATRYEYGPNGELIAEWNDADAGKVVQKEYFYKGGGLIATTKTGTSGEYEYATADHLGSPRAWTSGQNGNLTSLKRQDFAPFGEDLGAGIGIRNSSLGYGGDSPRQKFTGKEREPVTGLDNFVARSYSSEQGRFLSPDPFNPLIGGDKEAIALYANDPQNWNKYSYTLNQPFRYIDPNGEVPVFVITAGIGAIVGATFKTVELAIKGEDLTSKDSLKKIGAAALGGAVDGAIAGLTGGMGILGRNFLGGGVGNVVAGGVERLANGETILDPVQMFEDVSVGIFAGGLGEFGGVINKEFDLNLAGVGDFVSRNVMSIDYLSRGFREAQNEMAASVEMGFRYAIDASTSKYKSWMNFQKGINIGADYASGELIEFGASQRIHMNSTRSSMNMFAQMSSQRVIPKEKPKKRPDVDANKCDQKKSGCVRLGF